MHKTVGHGNLPVIDLFERLNLEYIFPLDRYPSAGRLQRYPTLVKLLIYY